MAADWTSTTATLQRFARKHCAQDWQTVGRPVSVSLGRSGLAWGHRAEPCGKCVRAPESRRAMAARRPGSSRSPPCSARPAADGPFAQSARLPYRCATRRPQVHRRPCLPLLQPDGRPTYGPMPSIGILTKRCCAMTSATSLARSSPTTANSNRDTVPAYFCMSGRQKASRRQDAPLARSPTSRKSAAGSMRQPIPCLVQLPDAEYRFHKTAWCLP